MRVQATLIAMVTLLMLTPFTHGDDNFGGDHHPGAFADIDVMFLKYHRADGMRVGTSANDIGGGFGFEISPKVTLGYLGASGLGTRISYWRYDQSAAVGNAANHFINVDTYTIDWEVFRTIDICENWYGEVNAGLRYQDFTETLNDPDRGTPAYSAAFDGYGLTIGGQLNHRISSCNSLYGKAKLGILMGDAVIQNGTAQPYNDHLSQQVELGVGVQHTREVGRFLFFARGGIELMQYSDMSGVFDSDTDFDDTSGVGFGGFVASIGFRR